MMNFSRWEHLRDWGVSMDWRHVRMIYEVLKHERLDSAVEIGCRKGFSTAAILTALAEGWVTTVHLVDLSFPLSLIEVIEPLGGKVQLFTGSSAEYRGHCNCWIIDGDHEKQGLNDYLRAAEHKARVVVLHDTHTAQACCTKDHWGSAQAFERMQEQAEYVYSDSRRREGEQTHRGLGMGFFQKLSPKLDTIRALDRIRDMPYEELWA